MKQYATWRKDKPAEEGFSHELISDGLQHWKDKTNADELHTLPYDGVDTLVKAFQRNLKRIPSH